MLDAASSGETATQRNWFWWETRISALDQPGNYLAPGVDERNSEAIAWLERRGWVRKTELRTNVLIDVRGKCSRTA